MHVSKDYDVRLGEFLDAAQRLFMERGYEETPIAAIIEAVGVSKGAFYHYFSSKEDLLDAIAERAAAQGLERMRSVVSDPGLSALDKLNRVFAASLAFKARNRGVIVTLLRVMYDERNLRLRKRMEDRSIEVNAPLIAGILAQGRDEGAFSLDYPEETAALVLRLGSAMVERIAAEAIALTDGSGSGNGDGSRGLAAARERVLAAMRSYREAMNRILGAVPGGVTFNEDEVVAILVGEERP